jgi:hypothetical protein
MSFLLQILKWEPDYFNKTSDLPEHMPKSLQDHIKKVAENDSAMVSSKSCAIIWPILNLQTIKEQPAVS